MLESVGGNQDRAIDALLVMSDPEYKGEPPAAVYVQQPALVRSIPSSSDILFPNALSIVVANRIRRTIRSTPNARGAAAAAATTTTMGQR